MKERSLLYRFRKYCILFCAVLIGVLCLSGNAWAMTGFSGQKSAYNESSQGEVTVTVTISNDGIPIEGTDGTALSHLKVTVPYFDLGLYGLQEYYRYPTNSVCDYLEEQGVVKRPTVLHLYIYLMERYYLGYPAEKCGTGAGKDAILNNEQFNSVFYMTGGQAYLTYNAGTGKGNRLLKPTGSATHLYMQNFWGHDENLMYYVNHEYPLMWSGFGSTADYILLEDGDVVDVGMFTDRSFWTRGAFTSFSQDDYNLSKGSTLKTKVYSQKTVMSSDNSVPDPVAIQNMDVVLYDGNWNQVEKLDYDTDGYVSYTFDKAGTYYLLATEKDNAGKDGAAFSPATAKITVSESSTPVAVSSIEILPESNKTELNVGESIQLKAEILPASAAQKSIRWRVDGSAAYMDYQGRLHANEYISKDELVTVTAFSRENRFVQDSIQFLIKADRETVAKVKQVEDLIDAIGSSDKDVVYTEECHKKILAARKAYDALEKGSVAYRNIDAQKVDYLEYAEERYSELEKKAPKPTATPVPTATPKPTPKPTATPTPKPVAGVKQSAASASAMKISWKREASVSGYRIFIQGGRFKKNTKVVDVSSKTTSYTIKKVGKQKLTAGTAYRITVTSLYKKGKKTVTGRQQVLKNAYTLPSAPKATSVKKGKARSLKVYWKKVSGVQGYEVQMSTRKKSGYKTIKAVNAKTSAYTVSKLKKNKRYYFRIRSFKVIGGKKVYSTCSNVVAGKAK